MKIKSFRHKGLKKLYAGGEAKGVPPASLSKLENMLAFLDAMADPAELLSPILRWKAHPLVGDRKGTWALSVTANLRLTFRVDEQHRLRDLDLEDYH